MRRVTLDRLKCIVQRINILTGSPQESWTRDKDGKYKANIGNYHLDGAYGGWKLVRHCTEGGGITDTLQCGFTSKRELESLLFAFIRGLETESKCVIRGEK